MNHRQGSIIRRHARSGVVAALERNAPRRAASHGNRIDLGTAGPVRGEINSLTVRRPAGLRINGRIAGAELFDKAATLAKLYGKLLKSYAIDALEVESEDKEQVKSDRVSEWLRNAGRVKTDSFDSPGLGRDIRIESEQMHGSVLVVDEKPVHLELFGSQPANDREG